MGYNKQWENYTEKYQKLCMENDVIPDSLFKEYGVNRGLRDINGNGVLTGLTNISRIDSFCVKDGKKVPCDGKLWYRGYNVTDWIRNIPKDSLGFGKTAYLLLFGKAPTAEEEKEFKELMGKCRALPTNFTRDVIMKAPSKDIMNSMTRSILTLASYDENVNSNDIGNVIRQCVNLISVFPMLAVYAYHAYNHYERDESMYIHRPDPRLSTAENLLMLLRPDKQYSFLEAKVLDVALMLHMEHGGGNNSTFTTHVVSSSGTDTYSAIAAALGSLKGPKHGGANIKVVSMFQDLKKNVKDISDEEEVREYLKKLLRKEAFDKRGLIYGMGHAIYSVSDPRAQVLKGFVETLAREKGRMKEYNLYAMVEQMAPEVIAEERHIYKGVSANVDFYSGFVYSMLDLPLELYTPIFAVARIVGWSAHRMEELINTDKIIRPAYKNVLAPAVYVPLKERE